MCLTLLHCYFESNKDLVINALVFPLYLLSPEGLSFWQVHLPQFLWSPAAPPAPQQLCYLLPLIWKKFRVELLSNEGRVKQLRCWRPTCYSPAAKPVRALVMRAWGPGWACCMCVWGCVRERWSVCVCVCVWSSSKTIVECLCVFLYVQLEWDQLWPCG